MPTDGCTLQASAPEFDLAKADAARPGLADGYENDALVVTPGLQRPSGRQAAGNLTGGMKTRRSEALNVLRCLTTYMAGLLFDSSKFEGEH